MTLVMGTVRPGATIYIPFASFDKDDGSSITMTGLAVTDIEVYKDGSVTQRASDSGYTLLDTDGIDFDGLTGIHGFSIDLADNTTAGFWAAGSRYFVVVSAITIDAVAVSFVAAMFNIGYQDALLNTTIATLASQTSFTLTVGPAEDDALNGSVVVIHDVASAVQLGQAFVLDYTGATKTVTLAAGTTFTAATTDNISVFPRVDNWGLLGVVLATPTVGGVQEVDLTHIAGSAVSTSTAQLGVNAVNAGGTAWGSGAITAASIAADAITAAKIAANAIDAATFAADVDAEILSYIVDDATRIDASALNTHAAITVAGIADGVWDELMSGHLTVGTYGQQARANGLTGEINDAGASTTVFIVDGFTEATDDHFNGALIVFTSGAAAGQARFITDYTGGTQTVTVSPALTDIPANNDDFVIVPFAAIPGATAPTAGEVADAVWDEDATAHQTTGTFGQAIGDPVADTNSIYKATVTDAAGATVGIDVVAVKSDTAAILVDTGTTLDARIPAALVGGRMDANVGAISSDATAADNAEAFFDGTGYAGTNNVIPLVTTTTTATTATNLTNLPTIPSNWLTAAGTAADFSVENNAAIIALLPTALVGGRMDSSVGAMAANTMTAAAAAADLTTELQSGLATSASISALNNLSASQVNTEVLDVLNVDTFAEPGQGTPSATASLATKIGYIYKAWRNRHTQTASEYALYGDDAVTKDQEATFSDNGTTADRGEISTGA